MLKNIRYISSIIVMLLFTELIGVFIPVNVMADENSNNYNYGEALQK